MSHGMIFAIAVVLLLGWLHSSRKEAARQDVDRRIVPAVLDAALQQVQFAPNGRITCFGDSGLPLPQYDRMTGGEHVRAKYRGYEVELCSIELDRDVSYTDPDDPTVVNAPSYDTVYAGLWGICRFGVPMPVSLTFTPRGRLGQRREASAGACTGTAPCILPWKTTKDFSRAAAVTMCCGKSSPGS